MTATAPSRYAYHARDAAGAVVQGFVHAPTVADASRQLRAEGKYIVDIKPAKPGADLIATPAADGIPAPTPTVATGSANGRVRRDDVIHFTIQLSVMVDTGVPLSEALQALAEQALSPNFSAILKLVVQDVQGGKDFSSTLQQFPKVFPKYYTSLIKASEMSGTMGPILRKLADNLVSQSETTKKVKGAMIYPAFMFIMSVSVTIFLLTVILPKFTAIFANKKAALPMPTQVLIGISDSLIHYWYAYLGAILLVGGFGLWFRLRPMGRRFFDALKLKAPIFGPMFHKLYLSRSLSTLGTMIQAGVQTLDALAVVRDVAGNVYYQELWEEVREKIQSGQQISDPLLRSKLVPRSIAQMIHSGEKTGELPNVLNRLSAFMEEDLRTAIKTTTQFIEPVMIGMMGVLIGGVAIAMLMPILTISKVMAAG